MIPLLLSTVLAAAPAVVAPTTPGGLPVYGRPVAGLEAFDTTMQSVMSAWGIDKGVLAVMNDGNVVYQRGFGCPENTPMRIASIEKPITAAAIRVLVAQGSLALTDNAFDLDQFGGGILDIAPWQALGNENLKYITIQDILDHRGGWDSSIVADPQFKTLEYGQAMGLSAPANREQLVAYMLSEPLQWVPGTTYAYSNFGYMVLGLIVEEVSGQNLQSFVRANVLTPDEWVSSTEIYRGQTFQNSVSDREPYYQAPGTCTNIFDTGGPAVPCPYGDWSHHEAFQGHGNLVASAAPLLEFLDRYNVFGSDPGSMIGAPHGGNSPNWSHTGGIPGTSTIARQRSDEIHIVVLYNERPDSVIDVVSWTTDLIYAQIDDGSVTLPTQSVDGFYATFNPLLPSGHGGYHDPFRTMATALSETTDGTKLHLQGSSSWSGVISEKMQLDAPLGTAFLGL